MHAQGSRITLETIVKQLLDHFLSEQTATSAFNNCVAELEKIKAHHSSTSTLFLYPITAPYNYVTGSSQIVQQVEAALTALQRKPAADSSLKDQAYLTLNKIITFVDNKDWSDASISVQFVMALIKHAGANAAHLSYVKKMLGERNGESFLRELKLAIDKAKALDRSQSQSAKTQQVEEAVEPVTEERQPISDGNKTIFSDEEQTQTTEEVYFGGDHEMIVKIIPVRPPRRTDGFYSFVASKARSLKEAVGDDSAYYPTSKPAAQPGTAVIWPTVKAAVTPQRALNHSPINRL
jgi:hypothetical protein